MSKTYEDGDVLRFGKHCGRTIDEVIADDPAWVQWAWDTVANFDLSDQLAALLENSSRVDRR